MTVTYLGRGWWDPGTLPRQGHTIPHAQVVGITVHHTVFVLGDWDGDGIRYGDLDDVRTYMRRLQTSRPDLGSDVPYSFVVFRDANDTDALVVEGRGFGRTGAHTAGYNSTRYGVAFAANTQNEPVTPGMVAAVRWVGEHLADPIGAAPALLHYQLKATACPGSSGKAHAAEYQPPYLTSTDPVDDPSEEDAMLYIVKGVRPDGSVRDDAWVTDLAERWPITGQARLDLLTAPLLQRPLGPVVTGPFGGWFHAWSEAQVDAIPIAAGAVTASSIAAALAPLLPPQTDVDAGELAAAVVAALGAELTD